ncbi:triphosphoribosyl-dephospho-CoA synthase [Xanthobacter sediminis]|uniref:triphosphoribosyl-dephospho-CoA synthase n=1 Tax=Xanthobacter sediminis TaxID=3119926 RepID=UPI00372AECF4
MHARVAACFLAACRAELQALKPGNVHVFAAGHGMETRHFEQAAEAAAEVIAAPGLGVGARILAAVEASLAVAGCNTNLGIILLSAPLVAAALTQGPGNLRQRLTSVLDSLTLEDADAAFRAIAAANPGGLGSDAAADVRAPARLDLRAAMALAAERDRIARQYTGGFADVFGIGMPALEADPCAPRGVENAYLALLSAFPDSHIARKFGSAAADGVQAEAKEVRHALAAALAAGGEESRHGLLLRFDASLKARHINPGTTADLTVASILAALLDAG